MAQATAQKYASVEVDYVVEDGETPSTALAAMIGDRDLSGVVVAEVGPAGGSPLARVTGLSAEVEAFLREHGYDMEAYGYEPRELSFDEAEAAGLDGTGRDGDARFPYTTEHL